MTERKCEWLYESTFLQLLYRLISADKHGGEEYKAAREKFDSFIRARVEEERKDERENSMRKYSVSEIDRMRSLVRGKIPYPRLVWHCPIGGGYGELDAASRASLDSYNKTVEDQLRTYMVAGVDPSELESAPDEVKNETRP